MEKVDLTKKVKELPIERLVKRTSIYSSGTDQVRTLVDRDTGEEIEVVVSVKEYQDSNFYKIWIEDYAKIMAELGGAKIVVFSHIVSKLNPLTNEFGGTNREIASDTGVSLSVVNQTINELITLNFMRKVRIACYAVNPNVLVRGTHGKRKGLLRLYHEYEE